MLQGFDVPSQDVSSSFGTLLLIIQQEHRLQNCNENKRKQKNGNEIKCQFSQAHRRISSIATFSFATCVEVGIHAFCGGDVRGWG